MTYGSKRPAVHVYFEYICWKFAGRLVDRVVQHVVHVQAVHGHSTTLSVWTLISVCNCKARTERRNLTERTWCSFWRTSQWARASSNASQYARSNGIGVYVTAGTHASTNDQWARPARRLVSSWKAKPCQFWSLRLWFYCGHN